MIAEESRIALRSKLLKQLLMIPGTYSRLSPVVDHPGFFAENNSSMFNTKAIAVGLPIHPKSNVLISRPIPNIPGVPMGVTTLPPVFMEPTWFEKIPIPQDYYEASERTGAIPGLPIGYTYAPTKLVDVYSIRGIEKPKKDDPSAPPSKSLKPAPGASRKSRVSKVIKPPAALALIPTGKDAKESTAEEDDTMGEMDQPYQAPGFGFVKRRGTMTRIDVERSGDNLEVLPIPTGTTKQMPKEDGVRFESMQRGDGLVKDSKSAEKNHSLINKKMPPGFLSISPFPGYDPDAVDRSGQSVSAIYHDSNEEDVDMTNKPPSGFTFDKNPILWPNRNPTLRSVPFTTDFPIYAPVLFDIIQPGSSMLQQILCQVVGIDRDVSAVSVQRDANSNLLSAGATFNLFIRNRNTATKWTCINLQVVDEDYRESSLSQRQRSITSTTKSLNSVYSAAIDANERAIGAPSPSGFTSNGDAYFPPPVNIPPIPSGYTPDMVPYYGRVASVKPQPLGITTDGIRFYNADGSLSEGYRNPVGGYDNTGQPFFVPKGCQLPIPVGFTSDGIPYFDIASILNQKGNMLLPVPKKNRTLWPIFPEEDDSVVQIEVAPDGKTVPKKVTSAMLLDDLLTQLKITQAEISKTLVANRTIATGSVKRLKDYSMDLADTVDAFSDDPAVVDPDDIIEYLKNSDEFAHLKPAQIRVQMDPVTMEFQSVHSPVTKNVVLRYRANRGDHEERDFFVSVEPVDVFSIPSFHMKLQGEGMTQIAVTFNPIAVHSERVEGSLSLIDETGKRLVSCGLVALRQSFIKITPSSIDAGWMLPEKRKEVFLKIENLSSITVTLSLELSSEANSRAAVAQAAAVLKIQGGNAENVNETQVEEMKKRGFSIPQRSVRLQPSESKMVPVYFEPYNIGRFNDGIEVTAPGGDLVRVGLEGVAGIPIALYPENAENSQAGGLALTPERTEFMKKFRKAASKEKVHTPLTDIDISILQNMMSATADSSTRRMAHTVDFGICNPNETGEVLRCVTIMNLSDNTVSIGLYPHLSAIKCKYSVKIPPRSATTVEIVLNLSECNRGNIKTAIEVICPEFQNIPLYAKAFVGQPLYFNTWDIAYFRPCPVGVTDQITLHIINESQYDIDFILKNLDSGDRKNEDVSYFSCMFSDDEAKYDRVLAFGGFPVTFGFTAKQRGPWMKTISFKLGKLFGGMVIPTCPSGNFLTLVGICIEPYAHLPGSTPDKNGLELMRLWMSHPKRVLDEYAQHDAERNKRFQLVNFDGKYIPRGKEDDLDIFFQKDEVVFRQKSKGEDPMTQRRAQIQPVVSRNKGIATTPTIWLGSTQFNLEPHSKTLRPGAQEVTDVMFIPPPNAVENITIVGFAAIISDEDHKYHTIQVLGKPTSDFLVFPPCDADGNIILDFGKVETSTTSFEVNSKWIILMNTFPHSYSWTLKFTSSKTKFNPFDASMGFGELEANDSFPIPFNFRCDTTGFFESIAEISIKDAMDRSAKPIRLVNVILRANSVNTSVTGFPDTLDFGSTVAFHKKKKSFILSNNGTTETKVSLYCRGPFSIFPKSFEIYPKSTQEVVITFRTLPLALNAVTASRPDLIKLEYCDVTSTVPYTSAQGNKTLVAVKKNYWGILQRKFQVYVMLKGLMRGNNLVSRDGAKNSSRRKDAFIIENGVVIPVSREDPSFDPLDMSLYPVVPELRPFYSYHFRIGYLNKYQPSKDTDVTFHYIPITTQEDESSLPALMKEMWSVNPGEKLLIPVSFHPPKEQTQFRGEARFRHSNEKQIVVLTGTGASADIVADETVDFGSVKLGSVSQHNLRICNRGLLDCRFIMDIVQKGNDFSFTDDEPYEFEGLITSGTAELIEIECCCESMASNKAHVSIRWEKAPGGVWQHIQVPLLVQTGLPVFRLTSIELDFKTTYINVNKTLEFSVVNDGNASCYWALEACPSILKVTPDTGVISAGGTMFIEVEFVPVDFEQLVAELAFYTDAGRKTLMCYGLVGVPYLSIPQESLFLDFGITAVDKTQSKTIPMTNTGTKPIHYEILISKMLEDGVETGSEMEIFFVQPANGSILPGASQNILIRAIPKHYGSTITAKYVINTKDGERYIGNAKVTGGRAIIKIAPPTFLPEDGSVENKTAEVSDDQVQSMAEAKRTALFEMTRLAFQSHIENLQDVLSGLRTEDIENFDSTLKFQKQSLKNQPGKPTKVSSPVKPSGRMSPTRPEGSARMTAMSPKKKRDLQMLQRAENQLQDKLGGEEMRRKAASGTVFDGSDLRAKVNRALELAHSRGYRRGSARRPNTEPNGSEKLSDASRAGTTATSKTSEKRPTDIDSTESSSEKFLNDLASLESDLEVLSTVVKSVNSSSMESLASTPSSGSSLSRYHAGSRKKNRRVRAVMPSHGVKPNSQGDVEVYGTVDSPGTEVDEHGNPVIHREENALKRDINQQLDMNNRPDQSPDVISGRSTALEKQDGKSNTKPSTREVLYRRSLASQRNNRFPTVPSRTDSNRTGESLEQSRSLTTDSSESSQGVENSTSSATIASPLEDLVRLAHYYSTLVNTNGDPELQQELVDEINSQLMSSTRGVIKLVKEQLSNAWVPNREFLSAALRQVQQSNHVMEALKATKSSKSGPIVNDFNLGLVRSGDLLADVRLFNLPNLGNLSLDFVIKQNNKMKLRPAEFPESDENELFLVDPMEGVLEPGDAINFMVRFMTRTPGFYQQGYDLESGGEKVISFSVTAMSGIPMIVVEPNLIEFGLVCRNKFDIRSIVITNTGSFKDIWRLDSIKSRGGNDVEEELFFPNMVEGTLDPRKSVILDFKFAPKDEGSFNKRYRVLWTGEPRLIEVKGIGGGARLKCTFVETEDIKLKGLEWGTTIVGLSYSKEVIVQNVGNIEGTKIWAIEGDANFKNMSIKDSQTMRLSILNAGTLPIPFQYQLMMDDSEMDPYMKVTIPQLKGKALSETIMLKSEEELFIEVTINPKKEHRTVSGKLILMTELGPGPDSAEFPFDFWTYDKQLALDDSKDVSVGRVLVGETVDVGRQLTNFGSEKVKYRIRIEAVERIADSQMSLVDEAPELKGGKRKAALPKVKRKAADPKLIPWKVKDPTEGYLEPNMSLGVSVAFESLAENGDAWQDARLIIEKCDDEIKNMWSELSSMKLTGAAGTPKLSLSEDEIDYGVVGKGITKVHRVTLHNEVSL
ncbi:UNVERIFIED_CONTAM: hypothetical protein HDU68_011679 [Siphonaria sp. JEL0065]|nr:hypothetical protein HDU68_011679 [Siphonaria sp. JEL0065]